MISSANSVQLTPLHFWREVPFWSLFRRVKEINYPDEELLSVYRDHGVVPTASRDDNFNKPSLDLSGYQLVRKGALVTNKMKAWQGSIAISRHRGIVSPAYYVYKPLSREHDQYLHYLLRSQPFVALYKRISKGMRVNQWDLEHEALRIVPIPLPDLPTQKAIADFLDRETARIDQLIEKKQRMVEVLGERETNTTKRLLSEGLNRNAARTSSKAYYLPRVPEHWKVLQLRFLVRIWTGSRDTKDRVDDGSFPFYVRSMKPERINSYCFEGEAVLTSGDGAGVGKVFHHVNEKFALHQRMYAFTDFRGLSGQYFYAFLRCFFAEQMTQWSAKSTVVSVRLRFLKTMLFAVPPRDEQSAILGAIAQRKARDDQISIKTLTSIDRLREFRSALITAAVTGQIDVSTWGKQGTTSRRLDQIEEATSA